ncbi:hypothetical protein FRB99_002974 [Tulasnella sp. 403]|nr:hypothetical protein FRB99_002974 [Tulasnella sp. 403]
MSLLQSYGIPLVLAIGLLVWLVRWLLLVGHREPDLPPGPPTVPLLGNIPVFPTKYMHFRFTEWAREYGEVFSLKLGGGTVVVLNSPEAVKEIMEKNSLATADRPPSAIGNMITDGLHMAMLPYGEKWRAFRKAAHEILSPHSCAKHQYILAAESTQMLHDTLVNPKAFYTHAQRYASSVILSMVFGKRAPRISTPFVEEIHSMTTEWVKILELGAAPPIDLIPALKYVPERFAPWKTTVKKLRAWQRNIFFGMLKECEDREARGQANGCYLETIRARAREWGLTREMIGFLGGTLAEAGSDSTAAFIQNVILLSVAHPDAQKQAQQELDSVVGPDRLPTAEDLPNLPYVQAFVKEVYRMRPVAPLSFPHAARNDVFYKDYRIPSGSLIFTNFWAIAHDEALFDDPEKFSPERYLVHPLGVGAKMRKELEDMPADSKADSPLKLLSTLQWGNGRRICVGMHLAQTSISLTTAKLLWAFDFLRAQGPDGKVVDVKLWDYSPGVVSIPRPFDCKIQARSKMAAETIQKEYLEATPSFEPFEQELVAEDLLWVKESRTSLHLQIIQLAASMLPLSAFVHILLIAPVFAAFSLLDFRPSQRTTNKTPEDDTVDNLDLENIANEIQAIGITPPELRTILNLRALGEKIPRSDCFKNVSQNIKRRCGGEFEMDEDERVRLAISMTLCELKTARYNEPPLECLAFSSSTYNSVDLQIESQSACVTALSRSAQFWASYSGYLREASQLCFVLRRWNDIDTAKLIYRNATLEKVALLRALRHREDLARERAHHFDGVLANMREATADLQDVTTQLDYMSRSVADEATKVFNQLSEKHVNSLESFQSRMLYSATEAHGDLINEVQNNLKFATKAHADTLKGVVDDVRQTLEHSRELLLAEEDNAVRVFNTIDANWRSLGEGMVGARLAFQAMMDASFRASSELDAQILRHRHATDETVQALMTLTASFESYASSIEKRLVSLNETIWDIQNSWNHPKGYPFNNLTILSWTKVVFQLLDREPPWDRQLGPTRD